MALPRTQKEITLLLQAWHEGGSEVQEELWRLLYDELKGLARSTLRRQSNLKKGPTSLVHEAYLRLLGNDVDWNDRNHFFAVASRAMRYVLIDEARRQLSQKRRAEVTRPALADDDREPEVVDPLERRPEEVLAVHQALGRLAKINPRHERLVELRYFAGLSVGETAEVLGVADRTVVRDWRAVRIWLHHTLSVADSGSMTALEI